MKKFRLIEYFSFILFTLSINAQNFEKFTNKEGFSQNTISSITKDSYGFLWYGTPNGLIKHDGYQFRTFTSKSKTNGKIISNSIKYLYNDSNNILWIATNKGLNAYLPSLEKFVTIPLEKEISITKVREDSEGRIWFSGEKSIYCCTPINIETASFNISKNLLSQFSRTHIINDFIFKDADNILLATTYGLEKITLGSKRDIKELSIESLIRYKNFEPLNVTSIFKKESVFWIGTNTGGYKTTLESNVSYILETLGTKQKQELYIETIYEDNIGHIWFGTRGHGLFKYNTDKKETTQYSYNSKKRKGISSNYIKTIFKDNYNVLWIGTAQGGLNKLDLNQKPFFNYTNNPYDSNSIPDNLINSILEDRNGKLWISAYHNPLVISNQIINKETIDKLEFKNIQIPIEKNDVVRCLYEDKKGFVWIGTDFSLIVYNPTLKKFKKVTLKHQKTILKTNLTRKIIELDDDNILFGGNRILVVKNPWSQLNSNNNSILNVKSLIDLSPIRVQTILKDNHNIWIGTNKGLLQTSFDGEQINITNKENNGFKLSTEDIFSLHREKKSLWIGTYGDGLYQLSFDSEENPTEIKDLRENDILSNDVIYSILKDTDSIIWISTDKGLVKFNTENHRTNSYDVRDGLQQNNFREAAYCKGKSGYFYYGGLKGLTIFKPENIKVNKQTPNVLISEFLINNKPVKIGEEVSGETILKKSITKTDSITINEKERIISFNLTVDQTSTPSKNQLSYTLEGFNKDWIKVEKGKAIVTYTNLSSGAYIFKTKAANSDGIWSTSERKLFLKVIPPWYKTWWSYSLLLILFISIAVGVVYYSIHHEKLKQIIKYDEIVKEKLETINDGKIRYFTNLSHEFRTPLTLISGPLERIIANNTDQANNEYLTIIKKNTTRLIQLVDQLITFRQAEKGQVRLHYSKVSLGDIIYPATEAFEGYAIEKDLDFSHQINNPNEEIIVDLENIERIVFNLLSNSFKHTSSQGIIKIKAEIEIIANKKWIKIDVIDNGKGIEPKDIDNIFERFYQLGSADGDIKGGGIGLSFCKSLVDLMEGEIFAKSNPGVETCFTVKIPSKNNEDLEVSPVKKNNKPLVNEWKPVSSKIEEKLVPSDEQQNKEKPSILVVEDEKDIQNFLNNELSLKYNVTIANNGIEALEILKIKEPLLIVSDVMMPEMNGYELCENLKKNPETWHIPVLMLTALGTIEDTIKGLEYGADEYLSKPFSIKHLELRIDRFIENNYKIKEHFSKKSDLSKNEFQLSKRDELFISQIVEIIEKNLSNSEFGVEELSREIGLSSVQFYRRLKKLTGQVPNVYIRNYRLQRAAEMLKSNEGYNVSEVRYQIGIESKSYFSKIFKQLHGISPSELIKKN
ncbi:two-component regulator propeller domain-containing protein [Wenyingzhuangia sp. 2_MG-2023]|nr:two-component regulator propeller domain-containing protein [Wenyingzhuangia sp. 2_MG-2023]MDO6738220.1 two-component regulator propeller domain-containing protein [Wenyingzhuangia sp. 2_MG-2023]